MGTSANQPIKAEGNFNNKVAIVRSAITSSKTPFKKTLLKKAPKTIKYKKEKSGGHITYPGSSRFARGKTDFVAAAAYAVRIAGKDFAYTSFATPKGGYTS